MCIRYFLQNLTNPKHFNNSVIYFQEAIVYIFKKQAPSQ